MKVYLLLLSVLFFGFVSNAADVPPPGAPKLPGKAKPAIKAVVKAVVNKAAPSPAPAPSVASSAAPAPVPTPEAKKEEKKKHWYYLWLN